MRCEKCQGSKKYMGSGMIYKDCELCSVDIKSKSYEEAIDKIMKLDKKCTREKAVIIFDKEFNKLDKTVQNASDL